MQCSYLSLWYSARIFGVDKFLNRLLNDNTELSRYGFRLQLLPGTRDQGSQTGQEVNFDLFFCARNFDFPLKIRQLE